LIVLVSGFVAMSPARGQPAAGAAGATGTWLDQTGRAGITIAPCGAKLCGTITWLRTPLDAQGHPKHDVHNRDAALQDRPICGLPMLGGFTADGTNAWTGGFIYDPESGKTYRSNMHLEPDGTLHVRGYVGIPLFGRSETWTRPTRVLPRCG
jgi:uncharacterized protein (DUF2147 family)